ncbi:MAG: PDZ domain-containing protein [Bacteroidetes bacterium]|nr:PDZ domain-containing protein [Bacteroidota bacterium]
MFKKNVTIIFFLFIFSSAKTQISLFVAGNGNDNNNGSLQKPLKTIQGAFAYAQKSGDKNVIIEVRGGKYEFEKPVLITSDEFKNASLVIRAYKKEKVVFSGARQVHLEWKPFKEGILKALFNGQQIPDRLYFNGSSLPMARYPDFDPSARVFNGTAADAISDERISKWKNPAGGYIHALHNGEWGDFHYRITSKSADGKLIYEGGWQNNRPAPMHKNYRFVENIFEELDKPGEWYYDVTSKTIYLYPPEGSDMKKAKIEIGQSAGIITIKGSVDQPVKNISIRNIEFTQTDRTFMLTREPLLRSDWAIYRGGSVLLDGTENISISDCIFHELGGNAIFLSNYNKNDTITRNHIYNIGASAIAFVGNASAVRSPSFRYEEFVPWNEMDYTPGPQSNNYTQYCVAENNLIHSIGQIEKQVAGVQIEMASHINVVHNTIYNTPRAGINIGDGCWGGHVIAYNDVFNTVLETGDHGSFNSWGRDRYWRPERSIVDSIVAAKPGIELLDIIDPNIMHNNRFQCDHGWDIDLDDGSSNYRIYNNVCLSGGLKLREGYHRIVYNNIIINNTFHPHVWFKNSGDKFIRNIVTSPYAPILMDSWGTSIDSNFFLLPNALEEARAIHLDKNGSAGDAEFTDEKKGDYRLKASSPALRIGFRNFEMDFGVTDHRLKAIAAKPPINPLLTSINKSDSHEVKWLGAKLKNIETLGERSAAGLHDNKGALIINIPNGSVAFRNNLNRGDVVIKLGDEPIENTSTLLQAYQRIKWMGETECIIVRNQAELKIQIVFKD